MVTKAQSRSSVLCYLVIVSLYSFQYLGSIFACGITLLNAGTRLSGILRRLYNTTVTCKHLESY